MEPQTFTATAKQQSLVLIVSRPAPEGFADALAGSAVYFLPAGERTNVDVEPGAECVAFAAPVPTTQRAVDRASAVTDAAAHPARRVLSLMAELGAGHALRADFPWATGEIYPGATIELEVELQASDPGGEQRTAGSLQDPDHLRLDQAEAAMRDGQAPRPAGLSPEHGDVLPGEQVAEPAHGDALTTESLHEAGAFGVVVPPAEPGFGKPRRNGKREEL